MNLLLKDAATSWELHFSATIYILCLEQAPGQESLKQCHSNVAVSGSKLSIWVKRHSILAAICMCASGQMLVEFPDDSKDFSFKEEQRNLTV